MVAQIWGYVRTGSIGALVVGVAQLVGWLPASGVLVTIGLLVSILSAVGLRFVFIRARSRAAIARPMTAPVRSGSPRVPLMVQWLGLAGGVAAAASLGLIVTLGVTIPAPKWGLMVLAPVVTEPFSGLPMNAQLVRNMLDGSLYMRCDQGAPEARCGSDAP
jgi:hypothetical protein